MEEINIRKLLVDAAMRAADYVEELGERAVGPMPGSVDRLAAALDVPLPESSSTPTEIVAFLDEFGSPSTIASAGGRYFGFVTGGALPATLAANYLAGAWDQNCFSYVSSPTIACIEETALRWVKEALGLPNCAEGALVTGATMAHFTCLATARNCILKAGGWDVDEKGLFGAPEFEVIVGGEAHSSLYKVLSMLGLGRDRVTVVPSDDQGRMRPDSLPTAGIPAVVCVQAGNVNSGAFDPIKEITQWAHDAGYWVHVDAAIGMWALASSDFSHLTQGIVDADSWAMDAHKWLNVPYDSGIALVRDKTALGQAMSVSGAYLLGSDHRDSMNFTPESSRRARAVEIWAALKFLGRSGLADLVNRNCRQARMLADGLRCDGIEILNEVVLNQVVVTFGDNERTRRVISRIQEAGVCWCGGTNWHGRTAMRMSVSSWATTDKDIELSLSSILEAHSQV